MRKGNHSENDLHSSGYRESPAAFNPPDLADMNWMSSQRWNIRNLKPHGFQTFASATYVFFYFDIDLGRSKTSST